MRTLQTFLLILIGLGGFKSNAQDFIRQIREVNGVFVTTDIPLYYDSGSVNSIPMDTDFSVFQLYAAYTNLEGSVQIAKLDEKTVGTFLPDVSIETFSEDPYLPVTTRADQPYGVRLTINGMSADPAAPDYARSVNLTRGYRKYDPATFSPSGEDGDYPETYIFASNGEFVETTVFQQLPDGSPTQAIGEENFSASLFPEVDPTQAQLARAEVIILPVSAAGIIGIDEGRTYETPPKSVTVALVNAYPRSATYAQIYKGSEQPGTSGQVLDGTVQVFGRETSDPNEPRQANFAIPTESIKNALSGDGQYTVEVLTVTPFNGGAPERLAHVSFFLDSKLGFNGSITSLE